MVVQLYCSILSLMMLIAEAPVNKGGVFSITTDMEHLEYKCRIGFMIDLFFSFIEWISTGLRSPYICTCQPRLCSLE